ncbi:MAG: phytoene desaturase family protein [Actinomycetota bacterium]
MSGAASHDIVVVGGGHNGLTLAAYLARAGLDVGVYEMAPHAGGGASTEEVTLPGFKHNMHSMLHYWIAYGPTFRELELAAHGCRYLYPEKQYALAFEDGRALVLYKDLERTCESIARFSRRDADAYRDLYKRWEAVLPLMLDAAFMPPLPPSVSARMLESSIEGLEVLRMQWSSPKAMLEETFESDAVRAWIGLMVAQGGHPYDVEGGSFMVIGSVCGVHAMPFGLAIGGSRALADSLAAACRTAGATIETGARVERITLDRGRASGILLDDSREIGARKAVVSNLDVRLTMLSLVGEPSLEPDFARKVRRYRSDAIVLFTPHLALDEPPRYTASEADDAFAVGWGIESCEQLEQQFADARARRFPSVLGGMSFAPTVHDITQAPGGKHTAFTWQLTSYHLDWDAEKQHIGDALVSAWRRYAPNLAPLARYDYSPRDISRSNPSMIEGGAVHGDITPDQMGIFRPIPGYNYRMPIDRLYLCGGSTHPMGGIIGACGRNAATIVADDLGVDRWWTLPSEEPGSIWSSLL